MSKRLFITLRTRNSNEEVVIEMPGDQPIAALMPDLLKVLNWPQTRGGQKLHYYLQTERGDRVDPQQTLINIGIENFDVLWIMLDDTDPDQLPTSTESLNLVYGEPSQLLTDKNNDENLLPAPFWPELPIEQPCLVSDSGVIFVLGESTMSVGRRSREGIPQIDLTELDNAFLSSRRHAEIEFTGEKYVLRGFNTKNGTLLNGNQLTPGDPVILNDGDVVQFGFGGVKLIYREPKIRIR